MTKRLFLWGIVLLTGFNIAALVTIGYLRLTYHGEFYQEDGHARREYLHRELDLSDTQAEQMKVMKEIFQKNIKPIRVVLRAKREQLVQLLMADEPDRMKIDAVISEINSLQSELQRQVIEHLLEEKKVLTDEQQHKFLSVIKDRMMKEESHHQENGLAPEGEN